MKIVECVSEDTKLVSFMAYSPRQNKIQHFEEACQEWDIERLVDDLVGKTGDLPPAQQRNLKAILLNLSPKEAAKQLEISESTLKPAFSALYRLIENLTQEKSNTVTYKTARFVLENYRKQKISPEISSIHSDSEMSGGISDRSTPTPNIQIVPKDMQELRLLGRENDHIELEKLRDKYKIILIKEDAGMGKTLLAEYFMEMHFQKVITIKIGLSSSEVTPAIQKLPLILDQLGVERGSCFETNLGILKKALSDRSNPVGVLIDNLEPALNKDFRFRDSDYDCLLRVLCDRSICSFTLITSRVSLSVQGINHQQFYEYKLKGLDLAAWREYFRDCKNAETSEALSQIRDFYAGNPEAMAKLEGIISDRDNFDGDIEAYWKKYEHTSLANPDLKHLTSVQIDYLQNHQPDVYKLLCRMGCYRYQAVPTIPHEGLICLMWDVLESQHNAIIERLKKYPLIKLIKGEYYLHPATREVVKERLEENRSDWEAANRKAAKFWTDSVISVLTGQDALTGFEGYHHYLEIGDYNSSAQIINYARENKWTSKITENYSGERLGYSFLRLGLLEKSISSIEKILDKVTDLEMLVYLHNNFGDILWLSGNPNEAIVIHKRTSDILNNIKSFDEKPHSQPDIYRYYLSSLLNVGLCNLSLNNIEIAESYFEKLLESSTNNLFEIPIIYLDTYVANAEFCLALTRSLNSDLKNTLSFIERLEVRGFYNSRGSWSKGWYLLFIGHAYKNVKYFDDAFKFYYRAIDYAIESGFYNVEGIALCGIGECNRLIKEYQKSLEKLYKSIKRLTKIGAKCDLAEAYFQLGLTYEAMGEHDQAEEYKEKAIEFFEQMEAPKQIERVNKAFGDKIQ